MVIGDITVRFLRKTAPVTVIKNLGIKPINQGNQGVYHRILEPNPTSKCFLFDGAQNGPISGHRLEGLRVRNDYKAEILAIQLFTLPLIAGLDWVGSI